ncbi:MAG TPA: ABC-2 family transporter protein [Patescibacteria group bacterium]|nr:ABC-2 family transporter protein [Patescibacteria group bacterium]
MKSSWRQVLRGFSARIALMGKYWAIFKINWEKSFEYRADFIGHLGMGIITFIVMFFIWKAVFSGRDNFNGYTFSSMMTYVLMTKFLHFTQRQNIGRQMAWEIKEGRMSLYLLKPTSYLKWWLSIFLADRSFEFFIRLGMIIIFFLLLPKIVVFSGLEQFVLFLSFLFFSLVINFLTNVFTASFAFWLTDVRLFRSAMFMIFNFFAGGLVPLDVMPPFLQKIGLALPFQYTTYFPIKLYLGQLEMWEAISGLITVLIWILGLFILMKFIWKRGLRRYEAVGQ